MASDSWASRFSTSSRRYQTRSDLYEETEAEEDLKAEYLCPFCAEDFDVVGLFCHIDEEHPVEAKNGVCPVCAKRVGMDIVSHITGQHGNFFKVQRKRRLRKGGANSAFSMLRKELREGSLQSLLSGSSCFVSSSNTEPDPLLSPFIFNPPGFDEPLNAKPLSSVGASKVKESTTEEFLERDWRHDWLELVSLFPDHYILSPLTLESILESPTRARSIRQGPRGEVPEIRVCPRTIALHHS